MGDNNCSNCRYGWQGFSTPPCDECECQDKWEKVLTSKEGYDLLAALKNMIIGACSVTFAAKNKAERDLLQECVDEARAAIAVVEEG